MQRLILGAALMLPMFVFGEPLPAKSLCQFFDDDRIDLMIRSLNRVDSIVPHVPPEEEQYLSAERKALNFIASNGGTDAKSPSYSQRWNTLASRPYYEVWGLREKLDPLMKKMIDLRSPLKPYYEYSNPEATKLLRAIDVEDQAYSFAVQMMKFLDSENRGARFLSGEQGITLYASTLSLSTDLAAYQRCKLAKVGVK